MKRVLSVNLIALMAGMAPASATDLIGNLFNGGSTKDPVSVNSWTGFYIGGGVGVNSIKHDATVPGVAEVNGFGGEGFSGLVTAGYDMQFGKFVAGIRADYEFSNATAVASFGSSHGNIDVTGAWLIGPRLGILLTPTTLAYVTGGYTQASFTYGGVFSPAGDHTFSGGAVGGGLETMLGGGLGLRVEYLYSSFNSDTVYASKHFSVVDAPDINSVRAVISYKMSNPLAPLNWDLTAKSFIGFIEGEGEPEGEAHEPLEEAA